MNRFFFPRATAPESARSNLPQSQAQSQAQPQSSPQPDVQTLSKAILKVQAITASAIFAALVNKGVLTADEAADHMREIAQALAIDVPSSVGADASRMLASYGRALSKAQEAA